jgi:general secretion pathway protein F
MPVYEYKGVDASGKNVKGVLDADSPRLLRSLLRKKGLYLTQYVETKSEGGRAVRRGDAMAETGSREVEFSGFFQRIKLMEIAVMTRQMATLIRAGIPVVDALNACVDQTENPKLKKLLSSVKQAVNEGSSLGDALMHHEEVFTTLYINMVRAGEISGTLDIVFERLSEFIEGQVKLRTKLSGTLMYPVIMVCIALMIVSLMMIFVVPKITEMFQEMGAELPLITRILIGTSDLFRDWWWAGILLGVLAAWRFRVWKNTESGREALDGYKLRMPLFGNLIRMVAVVRFTKTFGTLLASGVPILTALGIVRNVVNNVVLANVIDEARVAIQEGEGIAAPLQRSEQFPPMMTHMIAIGEKTGQLEAMLGNVAEAYETQVDSRMTQLTSVLEPIMIVGMGLGVGFLVFAILLPMLQMNDAIAMGG